MKISVFVSLMLSALFVTARGWNSDEHVEKSAEISADGYLIQSLSSLKSFSLSILVLSGVILYYIPETRSHARKGCCFLIDNIADGLKTVLRLKESVKNIHQKNTHYDSFISDKESLDFDKNGNVDFEYVRHHKNVEESRQREEKKEKSKRREKLKSDVHEKSTNHNKDHHRHEKHNKSMKDVRESKGDKHKFRSTIILDDIENGNEYLIDDHFTELSPIYSTKNCTSYLISGSPQQMAMLDEKGDVNIVVPSKLYSIKSKYNERSNRRVHDRANNGIVGAKELLKATCSVAKIISTAETVILNKSGLKSTYEVSPAQKENTTQMTQDSDNKEAKVYYQRTSRLKEKMNTDFKKKEKSRNIKETRKFLQSAETDEKETKTTGLDNKRKSRIAVQTRYIEDDKDQMIDKISRKVDDKGVTRKKCTRKKDSERISYKDNEDRVEDEDEDEFEFEFEDEFEDISEEEEIPFHNLNQMKPILNRAVAWLFGGCHHAEEMRLNTEENK